MVLPLLAAAGTAAGGAAAGTAAASWLPAAISAAPAMVGAVGSIFGGGGGQGQQIDWASLYGPLAQNIATGAQAQLAVPSALAAYQGTLGLQSNLAYQTALQGFNQAALKDTSLTGLQAGLASQAGSSALALQTANAQSLMDIGRAAYNSALNITEKLPETMGTLAQQNIITTGQTLQPFAAASANIAQTSAATRNQIASQIAGGQVQSKLSQQGFYQDLAKQQAAIKGQMARKQQDVNLALAGLRSFA